MTVRSLLGCLLLLAVLGAWMCCYAHDPVPPCANIMLGCGPGDVPPLTARKADGGADR